MRVLISDVTNPFYNLAYEEWLFETAVQSSRVASSPERGVHTLYLWRNEPSVIIGRNQNPWKECRVAEMEADKVHLARRATGGGAVFHDLGTSIFSFLSPRGLYDKDRNMTVLTSALKSRYNVEAFSHGRNDIHLADGRKISGSAFKYNTFQALHHGTLLVDTDMSRLGHYLVPNKAKLQSKGVASVQARVENLNDLLRQDRHLTGDQLANHRDLCEAIVEEFGRTHGCKGLAVERLQLKDYEAIPAVREKAEALMAWEWRFGLCPPFQYQLETRFDWGTIDLNLNSNNGLITEVRIYSDSLFPQMIARIEDLLLNTQYAPAAIRAQFEKTFGPDGDPADQQLPYAPYCLQFAEWLAARL